MSVKDQQLLKSTHGCTVVPGLSDFKVYKVRHEIHHVGRAKGQVN